MHPELAEQFGLPVSSGVIVQEGSGTPAARAGIRRGDIIVRMDGEEIERGGDLRSVLRAREPGEVIRMTLVSAEGPHSGPGAAGRGAGTLMRRLPSTAGMTAVLAVALAACGDRAPGGDDAALPAAGETEAPADADSGTPVAITIDDLPWVGPLPPGWSRMDGTVRILEALRRHDAPATGYVNCGRVAPGAPVLRRWLEAGHELGNHTAEHLDLNYADPAVWAADAERCHRFLRELTGADSLTFRYPYLHRGDTAERYRAGRDALDGLGATIVPVTINTGDWILDDAYVAARRAGDQTRARAIRDAYVAHVARAANHYREVAAERVGREIAHILLLHANALLADELDAVLARLRQEGFRFVSLGAALRDPVYALTDDYIGPEGLSWLYRIPPAIPSARAWDMAEAAALREIIR